MNNKNRELTRDLVLIAMFTAIIFVLGMTPIGLIPLGFINLTILHIPVIVCAMVCSRRVSLSAGFMFGLVSTINAFIKPSTLVGNLLAVSPIAVIAMSMLPRIIIPLTTNLTYTGLNKLMHTDKKPGRLAFSVVASAIVGSLTNTVLYLGLMGLFYWLLCPSNMAYYTGVIIGVVMGIGVPCEAIAAAIISEGVVFALLGIKKTRGKDSAEAV